jgi:hypothetical protein
MREWMQDMMEEGVFARDEVRFAHVTDPPKEAVELILASLSPEVRATLKPLRSDAPDLRARRTVR